MICMAPTTTIAVSITTIRLYQFTGMPATAAAQLARGFREALLASVVLAQIAVVAGITLSFNYNTTAGGTIVLVAVAVYIVAVLAGKIQSRRSGDAVSERVDGAGPATSEGIEDAADATMDATDDLDAAERSTGD